MGEQTGLKSLEGTVLRWSLDVDVFNSSLFSHRVGYPSWRLESTV